MKSFKELMQKCLKIFKDALKARKLRRYAKKYNFTILYSAGNGYHIYDLDDPTFFNGYTDDLDKLKWWLDVAIEQKELAQKKKPFTGQLKN